MPDLLAILIPAAAVVVSYAAGYHKGHRTGISRGAVGAMYWLHESLANALDLHREGLLDKADLQHPKAAAK